MRVTNWTRKLAAAVAAAGIWFGGAYAHAEVINHLIGDASFDDTDVNASTYTNYAYIYTGHVTAWEDIGSPGGIGGFGNWFYNSYYAQVTGYWRPDPRTGTQALHGRGHYIWQGLSGPDSTFESGRTYTFSAYLGGDTDSTNATEPGGGGSDRTWLFIYNADATPDLVSTFFHDEALVGAFNDRDGSLTISSGTGTATNAGWTIGGGSEWGLASVTYTATAAVDGHQIGVAMFSRADGAMEDVTLVSVPEPTTTIIVCGLGMAGLALLRRRTPGSAQP